MPSLNDEIQTKMKSCTFKKIFCKAQPMYLKGDSLKKGAREELNLLVVKKKLQVVKSDYMKEQLLDA